jgi:hypothetical protein
MKYAYCRAEADAMGAQNNNRDGSRSAGRIACALLFAQGGLVAGGEAQAAAIHGVNAVRARLIEHHFPAARPEQNPRATVELVQYWPNWNSWRNCYGYYGWVPETDRPWRWPRC